MPSEPKTLHFGVLSTAGAGHLNPLIALSQELVRRGHEVTFFGRPKIEPDIEQAGFKFVALGANTASAQREPGSDVATIRDEIASLRIRLTRMCVEIEQYLAATPSAVARAKVNALLVDEIALTGPTVAQLLEIPYFLIATSVPHYFGWGRSAWFSGYRLSKTWLSWLQGVFLEQSVLRTKGPVLRTLNDFRHSVGLDPDGRTTPDSLCLAKITQLPPRLKPSQRKESQDFHCAGPFIDRSVRRHVPFPWERLDGRPMVYASLGTTSNVDAAIINMIAEACRDLNVQLVISLGNRVAVEELANLPREPIVVQYAPQLELLKRAAAVITHGGANTVFETLLEGKPMVVIPLAYDQPALADQLKQVGVAEVLPVMRLSSKRIHLALVNILESRKYREAALQMQAELQESRGIDCAAEIIETALEVHWLKQSIRVSARPLATGQLTTPEPRGA